MGNKKVTERMDGGGMEGDRGGVEGEGNPGCLSLSHPSPPVLDVSLEGRAQEI